jgi:hypothetical protein
MILTYYFESDDGKYQRAEEEQTPESGGFVEDEDAQQHGTDGADACPDGIGNADRNGLRGFG